MLNVCCAPCGCALATWCKKKASCQWYICQINISHGICSPHVFLSSSSLKSPLLSPLLTGPQWVVWLEYQGSTKYKSKCIYKYGEEYQESKTYDDPYRYVCTTPKGCSICIRDVYGVWYSCVCGIRVYFERFVKFGGGGGGDCHIVMCHHFPIQVSQVIHSRKVPPTYPHL